VESLLIRPRWLALGLLGSTLASASAPAAAESDPAPRHVFEAAVGLDSAAAGTAYDAWTDGGAGKLRYPDGGTTDARILLHYRGRLTPTVSITAAADFDGTDDNAAGLTELAVDWRPIPLSRNRHRLRAGAIYPPFSVENGAVAWSSPFGLSYSAVNAWLAEEIRPIGVEWQTMRRIGDAGSRHELGGFGSVFYGNDPAATLLFWRGFALHDRQTRLNERIPLPGIPIHDDDGNLIGTATGQLDPITETDGAPGYYAGIEWRMRNVALVQLARYDNRADPESFRDGQWGWDTRFWHAAVQWALPARLGLLAQWMQGDTDWLSFTTATGMRTAETSWVRDGFDARFITLTRRFGTRHRLSLRHDRFGMHRDGGVTSDEGHAWTVSYEFADAGPFRIVAEALRIDSHRDLWPLVYDMPADAVDRQFRLRLEAEFSRR
jgi:hypothetical protein